MAASMKSVTETGVELSNEERNLLSVAYKVNNAFVYSEPLVISLPLECCRRQEEFMESNLKHRAEDRGLREETANGQGV